MTKASFSANDGNVHHTGHSAEQTPSAGMAEQATLRWRVQTGGLPDDASRRYRFH
jgi:hypothetical protein